MDQNIIINFMYFHTNGVLLKWPQSPRVGLVFPHDGL